MNCAMHCMTIRASHQINIPRATPLSNAAITAANHVSCAAPATSGAVRQLNCLMHSRQRQSWYSSVNTMHNRRVRMAASFCRFEPVSSVGATPGS